MIRVIWTTLAILAAGAVLGYILDAHGETPAPSPIVQSGSVFCALEDFWGNSDWRPCTDAMVRDI